MHRIYVPGLRLCHAQNVFACVPNVAHCMISNTSSTNISVLIKLEEAMCDYVQIPKSTADYQ